MTEQNTTQTSEKLSLKEKLAFSSGQMNDLFMNNFIGQVINPVYNIALKLPLDMVGYATAIPRFWDAITDPLVGSISDNFRSRWGRRKPFMLIGAIIAAISLCALWMVPPTWGAGAMFAYLTILSIIFYTGSTLFLVPFNALGLAMSDDYHERTNLYAWKSLVDTVGGFTVPWTYFIITRDCFESTIHGAQVLSLGVAIVFIIFCCIPMAFCKERNRIDVKKQTKVPILKSIKESAKNGPFLMLAFSVMLMFFGMFTTSSIGMYLNIFYVFGGDEKPASEMVGWLGMMWKISSLIFLPITVWASHKFGKKETFSVALFVAGLACIGGWWCVNPDYPYLQLVNPLFVGPAVSCVLLMQNSMMADICDLDEVRNGTRREAMFSAINGWLTKVGITGATAISGILLMATGFELDLGANQTPEVVTWMRLLGAGIPAIGMFIGAILISFYPLSQKKMTEIKTELDKRHAASQSED